MMKINVFGLGLFIRVLILLGLCILEGTIFLSSNWIFTQLILVVLIFLLTFEINIYIHKTNRDLTRLLDTLKYEEYSTSFFRQNNKSRYSELHQKMEELKVEHEERTRNQRQTIGFYEKILNKFDSGILLFDTNLNIAIQTDKVAQILNLPVIKKMEDLDKAIPDLLIKLKEASDHSYIELTGTSLDLKCQVIKFKSNAVPHILLLFQDSKSQHASDDYETWVNFSKVISHEILNGISPLISLTNTLQEKVLKIEKNERLKASMTKALNMIQERTISLQSYSERYRTLNRLPEPKRELLIWRKVILKAKELYGEKLQISKVEVSAEGSSLDKNFKADSWQMDQVFSNLFLNSIHALEESETESKSICIHVDEDWGNFIVTFSDNGPGINKENRSNIFVPFFTTRDTGSGIGLSVIKQILWKHSAEIFLSDSENGARFVIHFPKI